MEERHTTPCGRFALWDDLRPEPDPDNGSVLYSVWAVHDGHRPKGVPQRNTDNGRCLPDMRRCDRSSYGPNEIYRWRDERISAPLTQSSRHKATAVRPSYRRSTCHPPRTLSYMRPLKDNGQFRDIFGHWVWRLRSSYHSLQYARSE